VLSAARASDGTLALVRRLAEEAIVDGVARAASAASVTHPVIVPIVDVVEADRAVVSAFELGVPLSLVLRVLMAKRQAPPAAVAASWFLDLLDGVAALHGSPDYRPGSLTADNVLLTAEGDA